MDMTTYETQDKVPKKKSEKTVKYDEIGSKIRKLLGATGATYIPELCEALKQDWYPHISKEDIQRFSEVQDGMRVRILDDYAKEYNDEGVWKESSIDKWIPRWLKDAQYFDRAEAMTEARQMNKYSFALEKQNIATKLDKIAEIAPEPPKEEQKQENDPAWYTATSMGVYDKRPENPDTPQDLYGDTMRTYSRLWRNLAGKGDAVNPFMPTSNIDLLVDVIKPSRKFRLRLLKGLGQTERTALVNNTAFLSELLRDLLQQDKDLRTDESENKAKEFGK